MDIADLISIYPDANGILPNAECDFKIADKCIPTNHYCKNENRSIPRRFMLNDKTPICGRVCCNLCMFAAGLEGGNLFRCPACQGINTGKSKQSHSSSGASQKPPANKSTIHKSHPRTPPAMSPSSLSVSQSTQAPSKSDLFAKICKDQSMYIAHEVFFEALQEVMIPLNGARATKQHYRPNGVNGQYKLIWNCAELFFDKFSAKKEYFNVPETNRSSVRKKLCDWIYHGSRRNSMKRSDMIQDSHPNVWDLVKDMNPGTVVNLLDQNHLFEKGVSLWGITDEFARNVTASDFCRAVGILLDEDFRDALDVIQGGLQKTLDTLDDPSNSKTEHFDDAARKFNDQKHVIAHPDKWSLDCAHLLGFVELDPNDPDRISLKRSGFEFKCMYEKVCSEYKKAMYTWKNGTGGGGGAENNFETWEEKEECNFDQIGNKHQMVKNIPYLTWIYMADKAAGFPLYAKYEGLPSNCVLDGSGTPNSSHPRTPKSNIIKDKIDEITTGTAKLLPKLSESADKMAAFFQTFTAEKDGGVADVQTRKRTQTNIMNDLQQAQDLFHSAKAEYRKKKKRSNTKVGDLESAKKSAQIYKLNVDSLEKELFRILSSKDTGGLDDIDISSDSDNST